jgi:hypothetical protein
LADGMSQPCIFSPCVVNRIVSDGLNARRFNSASSRGYGNPHARHFRGADENGTALCCRPNIRNERDILLAVLNDTSRV